MPLSAPAWRTSTSIRTRYATASPPTCWKPEPTCAPSRYCQPYDQDIQTFRKKFRQALHDLHDKAKAHLFDKTDIIGSVDLAAQEFASDDGHIQKRLIVLSDFIEEDDTLNFRTAPALATE